jgi:hypothetical protein
MAATAKSSLSIGGGSLRGAEPDSPVDTASGEGGTLQKRTARELSKWRQRAEVSAIVAVGVGLWYRRAVPHPAQELERQLQAEQAARARSDEDLAEARSEVQALASEAQNRDFNVTRLKKRCGQLALAVSARQLVPTLRHAPALLSHHMCAGPPGAA